jgi:hypothetical protein
VNCGACHAEGGGAEYVPFRARIRASQLLEDGGVANARELDAVTTGLCKPSTRVVPDAGTTTYSYFVGADADASLVAMLVGRRVDAGQTPNQDVQMPPLVSRKVDADGHALLRAWIDALPACL